MQRAPPLHRHPDDRDVDRAQNTHRRAPLAAPLRILDERPQGEIPHKNQKEQERAGEPGIPRPPDPPRGPPPEHPEDERQRTEHRPHLGRRGGHQVVALVFLPQEKHRGHQHDAEGHERDPCRRHVHVHHLLQVTHHLVRRRGDDRVDLGESEEQEGHPAEMRPVACRRGVKGIFRVGHGGLRPQSRIRRPGRSLQGRSRRTG